MEPPSYQRRSVKWLCRLLKSDDVVDHDFVATRLSLACLPCSQEDFTKTSNAVTNVLGFMGLGGKRKAEQQQEQARKRDMEAGRKQQRRKFGEGRCYISKRVSMMGQG
eukprot:956802-Pelagomonas_calceolata.AAC.3